VSIVGLDLGTTKLRAAVLADGVATLVGDETGATSIPAVVGMHQGRVHVGEPAARLYEADPAAAAWGGKGLLGGGQVALGGYAMTPEQVVGVMVRHLVGLATKGLGVAPTAAVLCVPVWFRPEQREALEKAATLAQLTVVGTVLEPTAIAFHLAQPQVQGAEVGRVGVVDIGAAGVSVGLYAVGGGGAEQLGSSGAQVSAEDPAGQLRVIEGCCRQALSAATLSPEALNVVYATGGGAHRAAVRQQVRTIFGRRVVVVRTEGAVALGAALLGGAMTGEVIAPVEEDPLAAEAPPSSRRRRDLQAGSNRPDGSEPALASQDGEPFGAPPSSSGQRAAAAPAVAVQPPARPSAPNHPIVVPPAATLPGTTSAAEVASAAFGQTLDPPPSVLEGETGRPSCPPGMSMPPPSLFPIGEILAGSHEVRHPTEPAALFGLALGRKPTPADLDPVALPVLMVWVLRRKTTTGTLTVTRGDAAATLPLIKGAGYLTTGEHKAMLSACAWPEASYTFDPAPPVPGNRMRVPMLRLASDGLRALGRSFLPDQLAAALGDRLDLAPVPRPSTGKKISLLGLDAREIRLVRTAMEGHDSAREVASQGGAGEHTTLMLFILLTAFECMDWKPPVAREGDSLVEQLTQRAHQMSRQNHFEALAVHWSAETGEIQQAYAKSQQQLAPDGAWMKAAPEPCAQMSQRVHEAYQELADPERRARYRREQYPDQDTDSLDDLLQKRISALGMKVHGADEQRSAIAKRDELHKSYGKPSRPNMRAVRRPSGPPKSGDDS